MSRQENLLERLKHPEDRFTERKPKGVSTEDKCKTLVAFANSLPDGEEGILFIGVSDKGDILGLDNTDNLQKEMRKLAEQRCYPPIRIQSEVLNISGLEVVAVSVLPSRNRPHFTGPAYVRIGSESCEATEQMLTELIASRTDEGRLL